MTPIARSTSASASQPEPAGRLRGREGQREEHERRRDAVVQSALHVEQAADPGGHGRVGHDRLPERRVGRRQRRADEQRDAQRDAGEQQQRPDGPQRDREQQAHDQEQGDGSRVLLERPDPDRGGVREQQQRQGHLGQELDRLRLGLQRDPAEDIVREQDADDEEHERRADREPLEASGDERVARDQQREDGQLGFHADVGPTRPRCRRDRSRRRM